MGHVGNVNDLHLHVVENNLQQKLFVFEGTRFLVPPGAIDDVLEVIDTCHMGFPKAIGYAKARYYWPKMSQSVEAHCNNCLICIKHSEAKPAEDVLPPADFNKPEAPFEVISCDEFSFQHKNYLMIVDAFSSYSRAVHLPGKRTATVLINHILEFMLDFGFSRVIQTDGARVFTEGRTTEADARSTWELLNQMPSKPDEGGEIEQGRKQQEDKEKEQGAKG